MPSDIYILNYLNELALSTTVSGGLESSAYTINSNVADAITNTNYLTFNRNDGILDGDTYVFTTTTIFGAATITITISLTGTFSSSNYWIEASVTSNGTTKSSGQISTVEVTNPFYFSMLVPSGEELNFSVVVNRMLNGSYDDVVIILSPSNEDINALIFNMEKQSETSWCWSAVSVSVAKFYDPNSIWTQCSLANSALGLITCCSSPDSDACNKQFSLTTALTTSGNMNGNAQGVVPIATIESQIDSVHPIGARVEWSGGGGHFLIISGYDSSGDEPSIFVEDSIYGSSEIPLSTFNTQYQGSGTWTNTYFTEA